MNKITKDFRKRVINVGHTITTLCAREKDEECKRWTKEFRRAFDEAVKYADSKIEK